MERRYDNEGSRSAGYGLTDRSRSGRLIRLSNLTLMKTRASKTAVTKMAIAPITALTVMKLPITPNSHAPWRRGLDLNQDTRRCTAPA